MNAAYLKWIALVLIFTIFCGCVRLALRASPGLITHMSAGILEECDPELARSAIPANLKFLEGLSKNDPDNRKILTALSMGFSGYSLLFLEDQLPHRASDLYIRAWEYGIAALGPGARVLKDPGTRRDDFVGFLETLDHNDLEPLLWTTVSWLAWINLNLDKPSALTQLPVTEACLDRILQLDASYYHGLPYILKGISLSVRPPMLGGEPQKARSFFEKAISVTGGDFLFAPYCFARFYATRIQDRDLFLGLLDRIEQSDPKRLKDACLMNSVIKEKAIELQGRMAELFI